MSAQRQNRKEAQVAQSAPQNFKCGKCGKVQPYDELAPYVCTECGYGAVQEE